MNLRQFRITQHLLAALSASLLACGTSDSSSNARVDAGVSDAGTCHGDSATWASLTQEPVACTKNADCCVIINKCLEQAQVVSAPNEAAAQAAWPYCDGVCTGCIEPVVDVGCVNGTCTGVRADRDDASVPHGTHCGTDDNTVLEGQLHFSCGG